MAFAVDVSGEAMVGGATLAEVWEQNSIEAQSSPTYVCSPSSPLLARRLVCAPCASSAAMAELLNSALAGLLRRALADPLWRRARAAGAWTPEERKKFGVADDVYAAGLLVAFMAYVPFCEPNSIDGPSLQVRAARCPPCVRP